MANRELDHYRKEHDKLEEQHKAVSRAELTEINPATKVLHKRQREQLEEDLAKVEAIIAELEKLAIDEPPSLLPTPKRVLFTSATPENYAEIDLSENTIFNTYGYNYQDEKWLTASRFLSRISTESYDIWHHHGYFDAGGLVLCDKKRRSTVLSIAEMGEFLKLSGGIACAVWVLEGNLSNMPIPPIELPMLGGMKLVIVPVGMSALMRTTYLNTFYDQLRYLPIEHAHNHAQKQTETLCLTDRDMPTLVALQTGDVS